MAAPIQLPTTITVDFGGKLDQVLEAQANTVALLNAISDQLAQRNLFRAQAQQVEEPSIEANSLAYLRYPRILFDATTNKHYRISAMYCNEIGPLWIPAGVSRTITASSTSFLDTALARIRWFGYSMPNGLTRINILVNGESIFSVRDSNIWTLGNTGAQILRGERILNILELGTAMVSRTGFQSQVTLIMQNFSTFPIIMGMTWDMLKLDEISPEDAKNYRRL